MTLPRLSRLALMTVEAEVASLQRSVVDPAEQFFYDRAGWGYNPATETAEEGRRRGARLLAEAEAWARSENVTFDWEPEPYPVDHVGEFDCYDEEPETCEIATAYGPDGEILACLGCVDDADANYRRVVNAELALEAMPD